MEASVATVPVASKAATISSVVGVACPATDAKKEPVAADRAQATREERLPDALDPPAERRQQADDLERCGQDGEREHRAAR